MNNKDFALSNEKKCFRIVAVTGPTATGKTRLAVQLAQLFNGEIISVDSRQVYRNMDIGTGKDLSDYGSIPYHLIDIADPATEVYDLARFLKDAFNAIEEVSRKGKLPILCGGTALYLEALLKGFQLPGGKLPPRSAGSPRVRQNTQQEDSFVPPAALDALVLGVYYPRTVVRERIRRRLDARINEGMISEAENLLKNGVTLQQMQFFGLEYRELALLLEGKQSKEEMRNQLLNKIRQFAKRQDIFFRKMERENIPIHWLHEGDPDKAQILVRDFLDNKTIPPPDLQLINITNDPKAARFEK